MDVTTEVIEIKKNARESHEQLHAHKLDEMEKLLETHKLPKMTQEIKNLNRPITVSDSVIKKFPTKKNSGTDGFTGDFY